MNHQLPRLKKSDLIQIEKNIKRNSPFIIIPDSNWKEKRDIFFNLIDNTELDLFKFPKNDSKQTRDNGIVLKTKFNSFLQQKSDYLLDDKHAYHITCDIKKFDNNTYNFPIQYFSSSAITPEQIKYINLWVNLKGDKTGLHYDYPDNFNIQLSGEKIFYIAPPGIKKYYANKLFSYRSHASKIADIHNEENLVKYPLFKDQKEKFMEITLTEGDMLYLPSCWWHQVHAKADLNINLNFWWFNKLKMIRFPRQYFGAMLTILNRKRNQKAKKY